MPVDPLVLARSHLHEAVRTVLEVYSNDLSVQGLPALDESEILWYLHLADENAQLDMDFARQLAAEPEIRQWELDRIWEFVLEWTEVEAEHPLP